MGRSVGRVIKAACKLLKNNIFVVLNGAQGRDRTTDTAIFSRMLYQLSYLGPLKAEGGL